MINPLLEHIEKTDSTNNYLKRIGVDRNLPEGYTVYADYQDAGRGQRGNSWESEKYENLLFSTVVYPIHVDAQNQFILSQIISLAVKEVFDRYTDNITIKWPNDIYFQQKKISGILIENELTNDKITRSIIGVGINLNQLVFKSAAPNPVSLRQITKKEYNREDFLYEVLERFMYHYKLSQSQDNWEEIRDLYKNSLFRKIGWHTYRDNENNVFEAKICDIENSGILVLKTKEGRKLKFAFKEVQFIL